MVNIGLWIALQKAQCFGAYVDEKTITGAYELSKNLKL